MLHSAFQFFAFAILTMDVVFSPYHFAFYYAEIITEGCRKEAGCKIKTKLLYLQKEEKEKYKR